MLKNRHRWAQNSKYQISNKITYTNLDKKNALYRISNH